MDRLRSCRHGRWLRPPRLAGVSCFALRSTFPGSDGDAGCVASLGGGDSRGGAPEGGRSAGYG